MKKLYALLVCLFVSNQAVATPVNYADLVICGAAIVATEMANNAQISALRKEMRDNPEQAEIYQDGIQDVKNMKVTTHLLNGLTIFGMVVCRTFGIEPWLTGLAAALSVGSSFMIHQQRVAVEGEADVARARAERQEAKALARLELRNNRKD